MSNISPFDVAKSLSEKTSLEYSMSDYVPWMVNKIFTNTLDTVLFAAEMNRYYSLPKDIQRDFYKYVLPAKKRYGTWNKTLINKSVALIMQVYQCNQKVAESYMKLISKEAIDLLIIKNNKGGR